MNKTLAVLAILCAGFRAHAGDFATDAIGTSGSEFLTIDAGARGIGMGGAYTSVTNDAYSMYWNPAGLAQISHMSTAYMRNQYIAGITFDYLAYAQHISETGVLAGAFRDMDAGSIVQTDINGNSPGSFHPRSFAYELGWGQMIPDLTDFEREISMGIVGRFIDSTIIEHARGFGGDIGVQARYATENFPYSYGLALQNFGQGQKFDQVRDTLPFRARLGASINWNPALLSSAEMILPASNQPYGALGSEYTLAAEQNIKAFLRAGFETQGLTNGLDGFRGINFGLGFKVSNIAFDFAFVPMGNLGNTYQLSFSYGMPEKSSGRYRQR